MPKSRHSGPARARSERADREGGGGSNGGEAAGHGRGELVLGRGHTWLPGPSRRGLSRLRDFCGIHSGQAKRRTREGEEKRPCYQGHDSSGRPDSNRRPSPWQGDALPTEPRPQGLRHSIGMPSSVYRPELPKPPSPLSENGSWMTGSSSTLSTAWRTSCATFSPRLMWIGSDGSRLTAMTFISPR